MQITTVSFFRFRGFFPRFWAFVQMQFSRAPLGKTPDIGFHKMMGTGSGQGFDLAPNLGVYAILATWPSLSQARRGVNEGRVFGRYRAWASEHWTVFLTGTRVHGHWDGGNPFSISKSVLPAGGPVAVLTRATIARKHARAFWGSVPPISALTAQLPGLHFKLGMGERPLMQLMTFSLWKDPEPMRAFAYAAGPHKEAMRRARDEGWFTEQLFARFAVVDAEGRWGGEDPLDLHAGAPSPERKAETEWSPKATA